MDIVIIANFCRDFSETDNGRFMYLCKEWSKEHKVEIITSDFSHGMKRHKDALVHNWPFKITFLREPGYPTNVCLKRFYSHLIWGINVSKYLKKRAKPDVIYCAMPSLTAAAKASIYCKRQEVKFIIDIQDLWPEAFKMVLDIPFVKDIIFKPFDILANVSYKNADEIVAVSNTYVERAMQVNSKSLIPHPVFLGTNLKVFDAYALENKPKTRVDGEIWIAYCGTLGASYDITCVIDALSIIRKENKYNNVKFLIMGDGPRKSEFEAYAKSKKVDAVFTGRLPYPEMCGRLVACDIAVNPITHGAAQSIINKHGDYAASGLPVVNTQECLEYRDLVESYHMGFNCKNNDAYDLAEKIRLLIDTPELRAELGKNARKCAEEKFDRKNSYQEIIGLLV